MKANPEERTEIYFKLSGTFDRETNNLEKWNGSAKNKELIRAFQRSLFAKGSKKYRIAKLSACLRRIADSEKKDFDTFTKDDAETFLASVNMREEWSPHTRRDYIRNFKQFFLWFEDNDKRLENGSEKGRITARRFYQYIRKIKTAHPRKTLDYATILTDKDAKRLIKAAQNSLERAMVAFIHETGVRVGELLGIRLRDIERKDQYALVRVDGKTGERRVPICQCVPYLEAWINDHPANNNPNALLWLSTHNGHYGEPLRHIGVLRLFRRIMRATKLKKKANPHWFRHSRATINAAKYSEQVLCKLMGWELGSKQVRTYVHLGAGQVEDAFKQEEGIAQTKKKPALQMQKCVCGKNNTSEARYCYACGRALSVGTMLEDEEHKNAAIDEAMQDFSKIMANPKRAAQFQAFLAKFGGGA